MGKRVWGAGLGEAFTRQEFQGACRSLKERVWCPEGNIEAPGGPRWGWGADFSFSTRAIRSPWRISMGGPMSVVLTFQRAYCDYVRKTDWSESGVGFGEASAIAEVRGICISRRLSFKVTPLDGARRGSLWH